MRPCAEKAIAEKLPCHGPDGICYGVPTWEKRAFRHGEQKKALSVANCPYVDQCRAWWASKNRRTKA